VTTTGDEELDDQQFGQRWQDATTRERLALLRDVRQQPLTPRQARRIRIVVAAFFMAVAAAVLVVRLGDQPSVLVVGVYGAALIVCGVVIELSRKGRTRVAMWLLGAGLIAVALAERLLRGL
jgi:hypothetical protein